jgi:phospholipase C
MSNGSNALDAIKHVVVLMFENRSFDHLFGAYPGANGLFDQNGKLKPDVYNLSNPTQPTAPGVQRYVPIEITPDVALEHDFDHDFGDGMMQELFGPGTTGFVDGKPVNAPALMSPKTNGGFVSTTAYNAAGHPKNGQQSMSYYRHGSLQVLHALAAEFVLCDHFFCDAPATTLLNRLFMHSASTDNHLTDKQSGIDLKVPTIFERIEEKKRTWKMYAPWAIRQDGTVVPNTHMDTVFFHHIKHSAFTNRPITEFASDLLEVNQIGGTALPFYSFLMCWLPFDHIFTTATDTSMHPNADIRAGENLLAAVYKALRNSPHWKDTLLIVTFDENGGIYDHVAPRPAKRPDPNAKVAHYTDTYLNAECTFDFGLLGPRVPALLISPWLRKGAIASDPYQNTSILRLIRKLIDAPKLTMRDDTAPCLSKVFDDFGLPQARTDCPTSIEGYANYPYADGDLAKTYRVPLDCAIEAPAYAAQLAKLYGSG